MTNSVVPNPNKDYKVVTGEKKKKNSFAKYCHFKDYLKHKFPFTFLAKLHILIQHVASEGIYFGHILAGAYRLGLFACIFFHIML